MHFLLTWDDLPSKTYANRGIQLQSATRHVSYLPLLWVNVLPKQKGDHLRIRHIKNLLDFTIWNNISNVPCERKSAARYDHYPDYTV